VSRPPHRVPTPAPFPDPPPLSATESSRMRLAHPVLFFPPTGIPAQETNMSQFTQLNLQSKPDSKSQPNVPRSEFVGKQTIALFAGAVLATTLVGGLLLETSGCSRENDNVSSTIQHPITQTTTNAPAPIQEAATVPATIPAAKKIVKKRPTTALYSDKNYGVTFSYPKRYMLKSADTTKPDTTQQSAMNFVEPGGAFRAFPLREPSSLP